MKKTTLKKQYFINKFFKDKNAFNKDLINFPIKYSKEKNTNIQNLKEKSVIELKCNNYENMPENQISQAAHIAIKEIRLCKSRQELLKIKDKYKGLETFSKVYKKAITDRYEILF